MDGMRDLLRANLRRSLQAMPPLDRLAAAWPVVCGAAMAAHGEVIAYNDGELEVEVAQASWRAQMLAMSAQLAGELGRVAGVPVRAIHFVGKRARRE